MTELAKDHSPKWRGPAVSAQHVLVINKLLPNRPGVLPKCDTSIRCARRPMLPPATRRQLACMVPPATMGHVEHIAGAPEKMPLKSTLFLPETAHRAADSFVEKQSKGSAVTRRLLRSGSPQSRSALCSADSCRGLNGFIARIEDFNRVADRAWINPPSRPMTNAKMLRPSAPSHRRRAQHHRLCHCWRSTKSCSSPSIHYKVNRATGRAGRRPGRSPSVPT